MKFVRRLIFEPQYVISNNVPFFASVDSDEPVQPPFKLRTPNDVRSVVKYSLNIQASSKGSDQTARMSRPV